ncbi:MAG: hypothetical protein IKN04_02175, partial [Clostridia bacterium]|nr:hypothetical protein [Clostridia bacterium]
MRKQPFVHLISMEDQINAGCIDYDSIISMIERVFKDYHAGSILLPEKISQVFDEQSQNRINCMPSTLLN